MPRASVQLAVDVLSPPLILAGVLGLGVLSGVVALLFRYADLEQEIEEGQES
jgi:uncharacterized protein involved in exopolysaccharide biosynthesis